MDISIAGPCDYSTMDSLSDFDHLLDMETTLSSGLCDIVEAVQAEECLRGMDCTSWNTMIDSKYSVGAFVSNHINTEEQHAGMYNFAVSMDEQLHQWLNDEEKDTSFSKCFDQGLHTSKFLDTVRTESMQSPDHHNVHSMGSVCSGRIESTGHRIHNSNNHRDQGFKSCKSTRSAALKNLLSERKRRGNLNQSLYTLRAVVPFISKMDKASTVKDAITYIERLQNQVKQIEAGIAALQSNNDSDCPSSVVSLKESSMDLSCEYDKNAQRCEDHVHAKPTESCKYAGQTVVQVDVFKIEERSFRITMFCSNQRCLLAQLMKSLESIQILKIKTSNIISFDGHIVNTVIAETKELKEMMEAEGLKQVILDAASNCGLLRVL